MGRVSESCQSPGTNPDDGAAQLIVGIWFCLRRDDWQDGLTHLVKSNDNKLSKLAAEDLADPSDVGEQLKLAEAWYEHSRTSDDYKNMKLRARYWYSRVLPNVAGLDRVKVESRLSELGEQKGIYAERLGLWNSRLTLTDYRAATRCNILLFRGGALVWQRRDFRVNHDRTTGRIYAIEPSQHSFRYVANRNRRMVQNGGGLAEVEVFQNGKNIALGRHPNVSASFTPSNLPSYLSSKINPDSLTNGDVPKKQMDRGYWFLPNKSAGWLEISFKDLVR